VSALHDRIAKALGWGAADVQSLSMQSLRDLVRPVDPELAKEMSLAIQSGAYARGEPARKRRHHARVRKAARGGKRERLTCENCDGGLALEDRYGLVCPACEVRVAGPFESAHDIPDYVPHESIPKTQGHATMTASTKIWRRDDWKAPGTLEPIKYDWKLVRSAVADEVDRWLEIYRRDEPHVVFIATPTKPRAKKGPKIIRGPGSEY